MSYINGPVNYIQLNGTINNNQKNITIFMDVHLDLNNQTRCESFDSIDISQYLYNMIKNAKTSLDFFMEIRDNQLQESISNKRDIYIKDIIELFKSEFIIEKNKVKYSKTNPNVKLHYLDIRDHLELFYVTQLIHNEILPKLNSLKNVVSDEEKINKIELVKTYIDLIKQHIEHIFKNINIIQKNKSQQFDKKTQKYYLNKMINEYKNESLKTKINIFFNITNTDYISNFNGKLFQILQFIFFYKDDMENEKHLNKIILLVNSLNTVILKIYTLLTDIYFLRRILDKDYIENVITYCGRYHALNYIYFLTNYCNFKITKIYNSNGLTIDELTDKITKTDDLQEVYNLFVMKGETPIQCVTNIPIEEIIVMN